MARSWLNDPQIQDYYETRGWLYWQEPNRSTYDRRTHEEQIMGELQITENQTTTAISVGGVQLKPSQVIKFAGLMSRQLADIVRTQQLSISIRGREFVKCEGWTTLGAMIGVFPVIESIDEIDPGCWECWARIEADGKVYGRASAICGMDEKMWANRTNNQRRSMAQTRATAKAYRLSFAWIMTMGTGFQATTAEEMQTGEDDEQVESVKREDGLEYVPEQQ